MTILNRTLPLHNFYFIFCRESVRPIAVDQCCLGRGQTLRLIIDSYFAEIVNDDVLTLWSMMIDLIFCWKKFCNQWLRPCKLARQRIGQSVNMTIAIQIIIFSSSNQGHQLTIRNHNPDNIERQGAKYRSVLINMRTGVFAFGGLGVHLFDAAGWQLAGVFVFCWICWNTGGRVVVGGRVLVVESESRRWWNTPGGPGPGLDGRPTNPAQAGPLLLHLFTCVSSASPLWPSLASSWCCRAPATPPCPAGMHLWPSEAAVWVVQLLSGRAVFHE